MIAFIVLLISAALAFPLAWLFTKRGLFCAKSLWRKSFFWIGGLVTAIGVVLVIFQDQALEHYFRLKNWPTTEGVVISSKVIGKRAFRPDIQYQYEVDGQIHQGSTYLDLPGFGGRINRLGAAEYFVHEYPAGKILTVHYNPNRVSESLIRVSPSFAVFVKLSFGMILTMVGLCLMVVMQPWGSKPLQRTEI